MAFVRTGPLRDTESAAVVLDGELEPRLRPSAGDADGGRPSVPDGVGRQFAEDAEDGVGGRIVKMLA